MPSIFKDTVEVFRSKYIMAQIYKTVVGVYVREREGRMGREREREKWWRGKMERRRKRNLGRHWGG